MDDFVTWTLDNKEALVERYILHLKENKAKLSTEVDCRVDIEELEFIDIPLDWMEEQYNIYYNHGINNTNESTIR